MDTMRQCAYAQCANAYCVFFLRMTSLLGQHEYGKDMREKLYYEDPMTATMKYPMSRWADMMQRAMMRNPKRDNHDQDEKTERPRRLKMGARNFVFRITNEWDGAGDWKWMRNFLKCSVRIGTSDNIEHRTNHDAAIQWQNADEYMFIFFLNRHVYANQRPKIACGECNVQVGHQSDVQSRLSHAIACVDIASRMSMLHFAFFPKQFYFNYSITH